MEWVDMDQGNWKDANRDYRSLYEYIRNILEKYNLYILYIIILLILYCWANLKAYCINYKGFKQRLNSLMKNSLCILITCVIVGNMVSW